MLPDDKVSTTDFAPAPAPSPVAALQVRDLHEARERYLAWRRIGKWFCVAGLVSGAVAFVLAMRVFGRMTGDIHEAAALITQGMVPAVLFGKWALLLLGGGGFIRLRARFRLGEIEGALAALPPEAAQPASGALGNSN